VTVEHRYLLAGKAVELGFVENISPEPVRAVLKKNELKPWRRRQWCLPEMSGEFVAAMEDVLALYALPYDARSPTVCLDEKPVVLHAEVRPSLPPAPGHVERRDDEYERRDTANLFVMVEPLAGWRQVAVTRHRTKRDDTECLRYLVEERYPDAECICVVQDNLNTHTSGALYEAFPPHQARRILSRLEFHNTPRAGWVTCRPSSSERERWRRNATPVGPP
jgi:hypothetical protein